MTEAEIRFKEQLKRSAGFYTALDLTKSSYLDLTKGNLSNEYRVAQIDLSLSERHNLLMAGADSTIVEDESGVKKLVTRNGVQASATESLFHPEGNRYFVQTRDNNRSPYMMIHSSDCERRYSLSGKGYWVNPRSYEGRYSRITSFNSTRIFDVNLPVVTEGGTPSKYVRANLLQSGVGEVTEQKYVGLRKNVKEIDVYGDGSKLLCFVDGEIRMVTDVNGNQIPSFLSVCIVDNKGHRKFISAHNLTEDVSKIMKHINVYTSLNLKDGGRRLAPGELEYLNAFVPKSRKGGGMITKYKGFPIHFNTDEEFNQVTNLIDKAVDKGLLLYSPNMDKAYTQADVLSGGQISVFQPFTLVKKSPTKVKTGGIGYSFGLEFETSNGDLDVKTCKALGLSRVGDGSIDGNEFVTRPLHGDIGINLLDTYIDVLASHTLITNKDSLHVHVGGAQGIDSPLYNIRFTENAIKLASQVESEVFKIIPKHRRDTHYCARIGGHFKHSVSKDEIARFIFGELDDDDDDSSITFGRHWNRKIENLSKWHESRYKWINLLNCNSVNGSSRGQSFKTVEFRMFPASFNIEDVKSSVLLSLAFVWFVENRQRRIKEGNVSLGEVVDSAIKTPLESNMVLDWMSAKKLQYA